jgi:O-antigen/teichoic acid export membrane protein
MAACFEYGAKRLPNYFSSFMAAALVPFLPGVAGALGEGRHAEAAQMLERTYRMTSLISYGAVFLALLFQAPVIRFLLTEKGMAGLPALSLIMVSSGMALQAGIMGLTLVALDRPYIVTWTNILAAIVSVIANIILIPRFGLVGAGWSAIAATGLSNILQTAGVWHAGLGFSVGTWLKPHLLLGISILILFFGGNTTEMRIVALLVFIAGAFVLRLVSVAELDAATRAFLGRERRRA